jgi:HEAT repeat protein
MRIVRCGVVLLMTAGSLRAAPTTAPAHDLAPTTRPTMRPSAPTTLPATPAAPDPSLAAARVLADTVRKGDEPEIVASAMEALAALGAKAVPSLASLQEDRDPLVRARVVQIAVAMSDSAASTELLVRSTKDSDSSIRRSALGQLNSRKSTDRAAVCAAAEALRDRCPEVRQLAREYLRDLGEAAAPAVPKLATALDSEAIHILADIGPRAEPAVPALVAFYQDRSRPKQERLEAVQAMGRILATPPPSTQPAAK